MLMIQISSLLQHLKDNGAIKDWSVDETNVEVKYQNGKSGWYPIYDTVQADTHVKALREDVGNAVDRLVKAKAIIQKQAAVISTMCDNLEAIKEVCEEQDVMKEVQEWLQ